MDDYNKFIAGLDNEDRYSRTPVFGGQMPVHQQEEYYKPSRVSSPELTGRTLMWYEKNEKPPTPAAAPAPTPTPVAKPAPVAKKEQTGPIEYSPEIKEAQQRVRSYKADQWSGAASDRIFGKPDKETYITKSLNLPTQYVFDANKGAAGIGTPFNGSSLEQAAKASDSFLDSKKSKIKNQFQFQA